MWCVKKVRSMVDDLIDEGQLGLGMRYILPIAYVLINGVVCCVVSINRFFQILCLTILNGIIF